MKNCSWEAASGRMRFQSSGERPADGAQEREELVKKRRLTANLERMYAPAPTPTPITVRKLNKEESACWSLDTFPNKDVFPQNEGLQNTTPLRKANRALKFDAASPQEHMRCVMSEPVAFSRFSSLLQHSEIMHVR